MQPGGATHTVAADATGAVVTGLTPGTSYTFEVEAVNAVGTGPHATSNAVTALARPPYDPFDSWSAFVTQQYVGLGAQNRKSLSELFGIGVSRPATYNGPTSNYLQELPTVSPVDRQTIRCRSDSTGSGR